MINWCMRVFRAFGNMLAAAARDPLWAFMCIVMAPFRMWKHVLRTFIIVILSAIVLDLFLLWIYSLIVPHGTRNKVLDLAFGIVLLVVMAAVFLRVIAAPLLNHFDYGDGANTHGSARFATRKDMDGITSIRDGLLIGRKGPGGKLMRYDGPSHLLTMAPSRTLQLAE